MTADNPLNKNELDKLEEIIFTAIYGDLAEHSPAEAEWRFVKNLAKKISTHSDRRTIEARLDEVEHLRTQYSALSWGHYNPFSKIDDRIAELRKELNQ